MFTNKIYGIIQGFDVRYVIYYTINTILKRFYLLKAPFILCTDLFSLYQYLIQMGSINEKRLIIDLIALRQSYENKEINDIR